MLPVSNPAGDGAPRRSRSRTRPIHLALAITLTAAALAPVLASPASAPPLDDQRAAARRIEASSEANGARSSILTENYDEARLKIEEAAAGIVDAEARLHAAEAQSRRLRSLLQGRAAELYKRAGSSAPLPELDARSVSEAGTRAKYSTAAANRDESVIDDLAIARELLDGRKADLEKRKSEAEAEKERLRQSRDAVEAAQAEQERLLSQVQGEIAQLVHQEEIRRQQEAERRARAELERRRAAEAAARGSGGGGDPGTPPPNVPAPNARAQVAVDTAKAQLGKRYSYGSAGPNTFDCSGLTMYAWAAAGVGLPHSSRAQYAALPHVPMDALAPGDLVFYGSPIHHVGIYAGGGQYIHAPQTGDVVKVSSIYRSDYAGAGRPG